MLSKGALSLTLGANLLLTAFGAATGILLARLLGPAGRGELAAIMLWPSIILTLGGLGIPHTIAYFIASLPPQKFGTVFMNALILGVFQTFALVTLGFFVIPLALEREFVHVVPLSLIYLISIPLSLFCGICTGTLQGLLSMKEHSFLRVAPTTVYLVGLLVLFGYRKDNLEILVALFFLTLAFSSFIGWSLLRKKIEMQWELDGKLLKKMLGYGLKTQAGNSFQALNLRLDQLIMSIFLAPQSLGYYVVAVTISSGIAPLSNAVGIVTLPDVASKEDQVQVQRVAVILRMTFIVLLPLSVILIVVTPWLVSVFFGQGFLPAVLPAKLLIVGAIFFGLNSVLAEGLRGMKRPGITALAEVVSLCITVFLLYLLLPRYGIVGAAISSVVAYITTFTTMVVYLLRHLGMKPYILIPTSRDCKKLLNVLPLDTYRKLLSSLISRT